jgi:hypothetical protein
MLSLLRREPFEPFEIELDDGQRLHIHRAEAVATNGGAAIFVDQDGEFNFFDWKNTRRLGSDLASASA